MVKKFLSDLESENRNPKRDSFLHELRFVFVVPALAGISTLPAKAGTTNNSMTLKQNASEEGPAAPRRRFGL